MSNSVKSLLRDRIASPLILALCIFGVHCDMHVADLTLPPLEDLLKVTIHQGVSGRVWFLQGDYFSGTGIHSTPVKRAVVVYSVTRADSVLPRGASTFFSRVLTSYAGETASNDSGFFQISLPLGVYSFFVREDTLLYANSFDGQGYIQPALVKSDSVAKLDIKITYQVTF